MECPICHKGEMVDGVREFSAPLKGGGELILKNVPCIECEHCGEALMSEPTAIKLKDLRDFYRQFSGKTFVVDFQTAQLGKA